MARGFESAPGASPEVDEAQRPNLHRASLAMHAQSKNPLVREIIASRFDCPFGIMVTLAHDRVVEVKAAVAANPTAREAIFDHLTADRNEEVLLALVSNPAIPTRVLEELVFHKKTAVRSAAAARLDGGDFVDTGSDEDSATPELRDVAAPQRTGGARMHGVPERMEQEAVEEPVAPRVRTAPVRGFTAPGS